MPDATSAPAQIYLLGRFEVALGSQRLGGADWKRRKAATLLQRLALDRRLPKEVAVDFLWPDAGLDSGANNLYRTIYALRQTLNDAFGPGSDAQFFSFVNSVLFLNDAVWVDAGEFETLAGGRAAGVAERQAAHTLYAGDLLPADPYSDWLALPRANLRRLHRENSLALAAHFEAEQAYGQAIPLLAPLVAHDPLDEPVHRALMRLYALSGQYGAALRQYHICARSLETELGVGPEPETEALLAAIQAREVAAPPAAEQTVPRPVAPKAGPPPRRHNLPAFPDAFVGRRDQQETIRAHLTGPECRLLTLRGMGGAGKTRLAAEAARDLAEGDYFPDGLFFVDLAGIERADYFLPAVAGALNFALAEADDPLAQLVSYLQGKELLLLLDNFEHLAVAAPTLALLLQRCPHLKALVTSRHQLNVAGEFVLVLDGLPLTHHRDEPSEAARLFVERAAQWDLNLNYTQQRPFIDAICEAVGGVPLAIEMCVGWVGILDYAGILEEIRQGLDFLVSQRVDAPERHLSMRAVFNTSLKLLPPDERATWLELSVFRGSFDHRAARWISGASLLRLRALVEKSLLRAQGSRPTRRYQMHPLLRQFAAEQLDAARRSRLEWRHGYHYAHLAAQLAEKRCSPESQAVVDGILLEIDNLRSVWESVARRVRDGSDPSTVCTWVKQLLPAWSHAYLTKTYLLEGKYLLEQVWQAMATAGWETAAEPEQRIAFARVSGVLGRFCGELSQFDEAVDLCGRALAIFESGIDAGAHATDVCDALRTWARALLRQGNDAEGEPKLAESVRLAPDNITRAAGIHTTGLLYMNRGDYASALAHFSEALALYRACHEQLGILVTTLATGAVYGRQREFDTAIANYEEVARLARRLGQKHILLIALNNLAFCLTQLGRTGRVEAYYREALAVATELGKRRWQAVISQDYGMFLLGQGQMEQAAGLISEGLQLALALNSRPDVMAGLLPLAHWHAQHGQFEEALVAVGYMLQSEVTNQEMRTYAADLWEELSSELPVVFTQRAETTLKTVKLADILAALPGERGQGHSGVANGGSA